jgi:hypothetical protein
MLHISTVFVSKPEHISYAEAMSRMRMWLDFRKIETSSFKLAPEGRKASRLPSARTATRCCSRASLCGPRRKPYQVPAASVIRLATSAPLCRQPTKPAEASGAKVRFGGTVRARSVAPGWQRIARKRAFVDGMEPPATAAMETGKSARAEITFVSPVSRCRSC